MKKVFFTLLLFALSAAVHAAKVAEKWTVYGPYADLLNRLPGELTAQVPRSLKILGTIRYGKAVTPQNGKIDFRQVCRYRVPKKSFYVCIPIESAKGETVKIGMGADWWFDLYLNGQPVGDTLTDGNITHPPTSSDHIYTVKLRPGKNYLVAGVIGGVGSQQMVFAVNPPVLKDKKTVRPTIQLGEEKLPALEKIRESYKKDPGKNFAVKLHLEPGKQYCFQWSSQTTRGEMPVFTVQSRPDGGVVYFAKKLTNGRNKSGYFYAETPEPYAVLEIPAATVNELSRLSLRRRMDNAARFQDWRIQRYPMPDEMLQLSDKVVTPHFDFAPALPGKKLNLFTISSFWIQRNRIELEQRFNFKTDGLFLPGYTLKPMDHWVRDANKKTILRSGTAKMKLTEKADCIILDGCGASALTKPMVEKIIAEVKRGAGLVINAFDQPYYPYRDGRKKEQAVAKFRTLFAEIFNNKTEKDTDYLRISAAGSLTAEFGTCGKGRAVLLVSADNVNGIERINYEIRSALMGKAILWATGKLPQVRVTAGVKDGRILANVSGKITGEGKISTTVADLFCNELESGKTALKAGNNIINTRTNDFGRFPVIVTTQQNGVSQDWDIAWMEKKSSGILKSVVIKTHAPMIRCVVSLNRPPQKGEILSFTIVDNDGNKWVSKRQYANRTTTAYIKSDSFPAVSGELSVCLLSPKGGILDKKTQRVILRDRSQMDDPENPDFGLGIWGVPIDGYPAKLYFQYMKKIYNVDFSLTANHQQHPWQLLDMGIYASPNGLPGQINFAQNNKTRGPADAPERILCLSSPAMKKTLAARAKILLTPLKNYPAKFIFGDHETNLLGYINKAKPGTDYCFSPSCRKSLQELVKKEYGSLEKLNAAWKTDFSKWTDVTPVILDNAVRTGSAARWIDHRRNMDKVWTDLTNFRLKEIRKYIPGARYYVQNLHSAYNSNDSFSGIDYEQLFACDLGACAMPESYINAFTRKENKVINAQGGSMWPPFGGSVDDRELSALRAGKVVWQSMLMGQNNCLYYLHNWATYSNMFFNDIFMFYPDLTQSIEGKALADTLRRARSGVDRLILSAQPDDSGIKMLYSRASEHSCTFYQAVNSKNPEAGKLNPRVQQFEFFAPAIEESGRSYSSTAESLFKDDALLKSKAKVLILPFAQSISKDAAAAIRRFVRNGGTVIADFRPAISDQHGVLDKSGLLDDVFGIRQRMTWQGDLKKNQVTLSHPAGKARFADAVAGEKITLTTAKAYGNAGNIPVLIENQFGKGRAILLNFTTQDVRFRPFFGKLLTYRSVERLFDVEVKATSYESAAGPVPGSAVRIERSTAGNNKDRSATEDAGEREALIYGNTSLPKLYRFTSGPAEIIGYFACRRGFALGKGNMTLSFKVRKAGHVYDLINGKYLGKRSQWQETMPLEAVAIYGVLPEKAAPPAIKAAEVKRTPNGFYTVRTDVKLASGFSGINYPVRISFTSPDGKKADILSRTVSVKNASASVTFTLPGNARTGMWQVTAREVFGGNTASARFSIKR